MASRACWELLDRVNKSLETSWKTAATSLGHIASWKTVHPHPCHSLFPQSPPLALLRHRFLEMAPLALLEMAPTSSTICCNHPTNTDWVSEIIWVITKSAILACHNVLSLKFSQVVVSSTGIQPLLEHNTGLCIISDHKLLKTELLFQKCHIHLNHLL